MTASVPPRKPKSFDVEDVNVRPSQQQTESHQDANNKGDDQHRRSEFKNDARANQRDNTYEQAADRRSPSSGPVTLGMRWGALLLSAFFGLLLLAAGVWIARFTSIALNRGDWVGWTAQALLAALSLAAIMILLTELLGFIRLARISRIRNQAEVALANQDRELEERSVQSLKKIAQRRSDMKWSLSKFREEERHARHTTDLLALADRVLLSDADKQARRVIFESARRVAVVTAVVPITFLVMLFVFTENVRMIRRLAHSYGGRPGTIGALRLLWRVIMYVAASGAVALTDDLFGQFLGQDILRRLSRSLGEGVFVGALTARLGVAAIEVCRPLPHIATTPMRSRHVVSEIFPEFRAADMVRAAMGQKSQPKPNVDQ
ncbi:MAG: TIGR01620 family protein [Hyphomicrobiaceae bacterium]